MMNREDLHLLINEDIYLIQDDIKGDQIIAETNHPTENQKEEVHGPPSEVQGVVEPATMVPEKVQVDERTIPVAIFHESSDDSELELLQKIISACKLNPDSYQVFANGFNKEVKFHKALIFVASSKSFYTAIPYQGSQLLCSKPLKEIAENQQEKVKLWGALKTFF